MNDEASYVCDSCGEEIVVPIDLSAGDLPSGWAGSLNLDDGQLRAGEAFIAVPE
jgi:hypothetical protein